MAMQMAAGAADRQVVGSLETMAIFPCDEGAMRSMDTF